MSLSDSEVAWFWDHVANKQKKMSFLKDDSNHRTNRNIKHWVVSIKQEKSLRELWDNIK